MSMLAVLEGSAFFAGTAMGTASILSVGPNNLMLMKEGLIRGRVGLVAATVWASYLVLLVTALALTSTIAEQGGMVRPVLSWLGLVAIAWFAFASLRSYALASNTFRTESHGREESLTCILRVLAMVWCNPLTYVDLVFIPAAVGGSFIMPICRVLFILGLMTIATVASFGYSFGGGLCAPFFRKANRLRMFDLASGVILSCLACIMAVALVLSRAHGP